MSVHLFMERDGTIRVGGPGGPVWQVGDPIPKSSRHHNGPPPAFTCPVCGAESWHPEDGRQGYCGRCHAHTGDPTTATLVREQQALALHKAKSDARPSGVLASQQWRYGDRKPWLGPRIARALHWLADLFEPLP